MYLFILSFLFTPAQAESSIQSESRYYIEQIKKNNPTSQTKLSMRSGLIQVVGNSPGIKINSDGTLPFVAMDGTRRFENSKWGLEGHFLYGQNILYPNDTTNNGADKFFMTLDLGFRYIYEFDPTRKGNYFAARSMMHMMQNNFELEDASSVSYKPFLVKEYSGIDFGVERGLTLTERIHLQASLDLFLSLANKEESSMDIKDNGYGLFVRGEFNYLIAPKDQIGLAYWQAAYTSEFDSEGKQDSGRQNFVTTYRGLSISYTKLF